eukprot:3930025-Rhodomonas_salina.1
MPQTAHESQRTRQHMPQDHNCAKRANDRASPSHRRMKRKKRWNASEGRSEKGGEHTQSTQTKQKRAHQDKHRIRHVISGSGTSWVSMDAGEQLRAGETLAEERNIDEAEQHGGGGEADALQTCAQESYENTETERGAETRARSRVQDENPITTKTHAPQFVGELAGAEYRKTRFCARGCADSRTARPQRL